MADSTLVASVPVTPRPTRLLEFDVLRVLCCLGVLGIHISGFYWAQQGLDRSFTHLATFAVLNEAVRYALFGFMFLSGVMLTVRQTAFRVGAFLSKRVFTILIPYLVWNLLYFPVKMARPLLHGEWDVLALALRKNWWDWLLFGTWDHLYYINMLFQMLLLYALLHRPVAWLLAHRARAFTLLAVVALVYPAWVYLRFVQYRHPGFALPFDFPVAFAYDGGDGRFEYTPLSGLLQWLMRNPNRTAFEWLAPFTFGLVAGAYYAEVLAWARRWWPVLLLAALGALAGLAAISGTPWFTATRVEELQNYGWPNSYHLPLLRLVYAFAFTCLTLVGATALLARLGEAKPGWLRLLSAFSAAAFGIYLAHPALLWLLREYHIPGSGHGISFALYGHSPYLYLAAVGLGVTTLSFAGVWAVQTLSTRARWLGWVSRALFGG